MANRPKLVADFVCTVGNYRRYIRRIKRPNPRVNGIEALKKAGAEVWASKEPTALHAAAGPLLESLDDETLRINVRELVNSTEETLWGKRNDANWQELRARLEDWANSEPIVSPAVSVKDLNDLTQRANDVTPDLLRELETRITSENLKARRFLLDQAARAGGPVTEKVGADVEPAAGGKDKTKRITQGEANVKALELLKNPENRTIRALSKAIGCSKGLVQKLSAWKVFQDEKRRREKPTAPKAVSLTDAVLANEGQDDNELERLIAE
ncbi:MAG: hypothetical protein ACLP9L_14150 [Thermoguttaceae bacterium]